MELCLYHPLGYYQSPRIKIGREGDFLTSPTITPAFGKLIASQLMEIWQVLGGSRLSVLEWGGGNGALADAVLKSSERNSEFYKGLQYDIVEKNQPSTHPSNKSIHWHQNVADIPPFDGCVISNELIDNFPVHQVVMQEKLMEVFVGYKKGFTEVLVPARHELVAYFEEMNIELPMGHRAEVNLDARQWIQLVSEKLHRGFVITIDYGTLAHELYHSKRSAGSLLCYYKHQVHDNPYINIGNQDITAHVNFSALMRWGEQAGLCTTGYVTQLNFLRALGLNQYLRDLEVTQYPRQIADRNWMLQHFIFEMGNRIKVLVQHKGLHAPRLSGLFFANPVVMEEMFL